MFFGRRKSVPSQVTGEPNAAASAPAPQTPAETGPTPPQFRHRRCGARHSRTHRNRSDLDGSQGRRSRKRRAQRGRRNRDGAGRHPRAHRRSRRTDRYRPIDDQRFAKTADMFAGTAQQIGEQVRAADSLTREAGDAAGEASASVVRLRKILQRHRQRRRSDFGDRAPDLAAGAQFHHRSGPRGRRRTRLCGRGARGQGARAANAGSDRGHPQEDRNAAKRCRRIGCGGRAHRRRHRPAQAGFRERQRRDVRAERLDRDLASRHRRDRRLHRLGQRWRIADQRRRRRSDDAWRRRVPGRRCGVCACRKAESALHDPAAPERHRRPAQTRTPALPAQGRNPHRGRHPWRHGLRSVDGRHVRSSCPIMCASPRTTRHGSPSPSLANAPCAWSSAAPQACRSSFRTRRPPCSSPSKTSSGAFARTIRSLSRARSNRPRRTRRRT